MLNSQTQTHRNFAACTHILNIPIILWTSEAWEVEREREKKHPSQAAALFFPTLFLFYTHAIQKAAVQPFMAGNTKRLHNRAEWINETLKDQHGEKKNVDDTLLICVTLCVCVCMLSVCMLTSVCMCRLYIYFPRSLPRAARQEKKINKAGGQWR